MPLTMPKSLESVSDKESSHSEEEGSGASSYGCPMGEVVDKMAHSMKLLGDMNEQLDELV
jgi:hypothetical protein